MIINFTVGNYRSFKDKKVLSMEATAIKELNESVIEKEGLPGNRDTRRSAT